MDRFNHYMLTLARESRGMTQNDLRVLLGVSQGTLSKYETGRAVPPDAALEELSRALRYPIAFFLEPGRAYGFPPFHYRKRKKLSAKALGKIVAEMNIRRMHINKLALSFELPDNQLIPEIDRDDYRWVTKREPTIEDFARSVREAWMLPSGPVPNMVELIEEHGGVVIPCDFGSDLIDAMSQRIDGMPVLFFVNKNAPADRVRYTLAHELGHMSLHTIALKGDEEMEDEADAFAGAFMLPASELRPQLGRRFDLWHLANLKEIWKVSMAAIAYRASRLGLITPYQNKMFWIEMGRLGYRKHEPNEPEQEIPTLLPRMIDFHRNKLGYSDEDLSGLLLLSVEEFGSMYGDHEFWPARTRHRHLQVVR